MRRALLALGCTVLWGVASAAWNGRVVGGAGVGLEGVEVKQLGTLAQALTDSEGFYALEPAEEGLSSSASVSSSSAGDLPAAIIRSMSDEAKVSWRGGLLRVEAPAGLAQKATLVSLRGEVLSSRQIEAGASVSFDLQGFNGLALLRLESAGRGRSYSLRNPKLRAQPLAAQTALSPYTLAFAKEGYIGQELGVESDSLLLPDVVLALKAPVPPRIDSLNLVGGYTEGGVLEAVYKFVDYNLDAEGTSLFQWYRNGVAIEGATQKNYVLVAEDYRQQLKVEVVPVAQSAEAAVGLAAVAEKRLVDESKEVYNEKDGLYYKVAVLGSQTWMAEDLKTPLENHRCERDLASNCTEMGYLYKEAGVLDGRANNLDSGVVQGLCPAGWHLPSRFDWDTLTAFLALDQSTFARSHLQSTTLWYNNINGVDTYGFHATPTGAYINGAYSTYANERVVWFTVGNEYASLRTGLRDLVLASYSMKEDDYVAARCLKDKESYEPILHKGVALGSNSKDSVIGMGYRYYDGDNDAIAQTSFQWFREAKALGGATDSAYRVGEEDYNRNLSVCMKAVNSKKQESDSLCVSFGKPKGFSPPAVNSIGISGTWALGEVLKVEYSYADAQGDLEDRTDIQWLRNKGAIAGATQASYTVTDEDLLKKALGVRLTPYAKTGGALAGAAKTVYLTAPVAKNVSISTGNGLGDEWTLNYTYTDAEGDLEGESRFLWYRNGVPMAGENSRTYQSKESDLGDTISVEVVPMAMTGMLLEGGAARGQTVIKVDKRLAYLKDSRDGQSYDVVRIGTQLWMAENLNYDEGKTSNCTNNQCGTYGRLYTWEEAMNTASGVAPASNQGICPSGWHVPSKEEWATLANFIASEHGIPQDDDWWLGVGEYLKTTTGWNVANNDIVDDNGTDAYGFSALPTGLKNGTSSWLNAGWQAYWWSRTEYTNTSMAYFAQINADDAYINAFNKVEDTDQKFVLGNFSKTQGIAVRCVAD